MAAGLAAVQPRDDRSDTVRGVAGEAKAASEAVQQPARWTVGLPRVDSNHQPSD